MKTALWMAENSDYLKEQRGASAPPPTPLSSGFSRRFCLFPEKEAKIAKEKELGVYKERKVGRKAASCLAPPPAALAQPVFLAFSIVSISSSASPTGSQTVSQDVDLASLAKANVMLPCSRGGRLGSARPSAPARPTRPSGRCWSRRRSPPKSTTTS